MDKLTIDVQGLPDEKVRELQQMIERWKQQANEIPQPKTQEERTSDAIVFATHNSKVNGPLTRDDIYAYL